MSKSFVALNEEHCRICGNVVDTSIVLDKYMRDKFDSYSPIHTLSEKLCEECESKVKEYVGLVVITNAHSSTTLSPTEVNRTGEIVWIRKQAFEELFNHKATTTHVWIDNAIKERLAEMQKQSEAHHEETKE